ncbi:protein hu-li tai shao isoform X1 [Drosophila persimilis]|uniref:protein hu-li tai shao isoform X1 n=1 Tax=Drosophila persimilis TaxID=7234 RepID=UPI000F0855F6|nr:protein hu-li tai shao isoform X1 [Drosophila persimilis]XP_026842012.1 protein hu-li tai shao isoform X1 [Drosophila persimilis]
MTEVEQPPQNGIDPTAGDHDEDSKARPADIEQDMREMERRKRVEAIMGSRLFREELERIVDSAREGGGGASGILQQLSDIVGVPVSRVGSVFKSSSCMVPINDIRGVESMGYAKGEKILRCKLAATFRLLDLYGWTQGLGAQITARLKVDQEYFLVNPYGLLYHEVTASALNKVDMQGHIVEQGTTNFGVNKSHFVLHSVVHAARPDIRCAIYIGCSPVVAISSLKTGLLPLTRDACVLGEITTHAYTGLLDEEERNRLVRSLGPNSKVILLANHGALCCGETIEEAFFAACHIVQACETQLKLLPVGVDNLVLIPEETRKIIYEQSRRPPEDLEKKFAAVTAAEDGATATEPAVAEQAAPTPKIGSPPKWRVGGADFEALMRMLDNAGYRTGYIYRHPLIKSDPPKPKNDVELPPAVSSLGYLLEEEELFRQGIWKKGDLRKGGDRSRWLNSPNVYQKVEVLETGTPDPKKITKWVAEGSPTHSTPVRIEDPLQFVPCGTNTKEFKRVQQQIKDNRRADKISAGPQSHILEGVTWDEANRIKDATVSQAGDHVVLMGAASKGIIQRGFQHNATVYKAPYAKNPFDNVTDDELNEYKRTVERKKKSIHGEYTDTDFSESEALNSMQAAGALAHAKHAQSEPETEHQIIQIQTQQAPIPSQAEVVLSDEVRSYLTRKYSFLWDPRQYLDACVGATHRVQQVNVIHKVDTVSRHNYPPINIHNNINHNTTMENNATSAWVDLPSSTPHRGPIVNSPNAGETVPFRTISHYGFNCPLNSAPSILLHPEHKSIWQNVSEQRENVFSFINLSILTKENRKMLDVLAAAATTPTSASTVKQQPLSSPTYVSEKQIRLEPTPPQRKQRVYSATASSGRSFDDSLDELESMFESITMASPQRQPQSQDYSLYRSYNFLPRDHALSVDTDANGNGVKHSRRPEAEQSIYQNGDDSGLGRRRERTTTSNGSSTQEAEAYTPGKHVRLTLSSSPLAGATSPTPTTIEVLINVSLRNAECVQTVQTHEQEFRAKLEKVIDEEIHYISQQLATRQRTAQILQDQPAPTRAPLATPTPSQLLQRSNSAPVLCHAYSYVDLAETDMTGKPSPSTISDSGVGAGAASGSSPLVSPGEADLNTHLSSFENMLQSLLNNVIKAHMLHNQAFITDCRARFSQLSEGLASCGISPVKSLNHY